MKNIYVGNLDFGTTDETLRELFERFGTVEKVSLVRDRDTGQPRGFAFVEMTDAAQADKAISDLNGTTVGSRAISVNEARPKPAGGRSGGGGSRGQGGPARQRREPRW